MGRRAIIVGGGVIGLSIARALTERGITDVLVLERAMLAGGGTGKSSGIIRAHYGVPSLVAMTWLSLPVFEALGADIGFRQTGYAVIVGGGNVEALEANTAMHQHLGVDVELIGTDRLAALWPYLNVEDVALASYEPRGGFADASQLAMHYSGAARAGGATIRQSTPIARLLTSNDAVTGVELQSGERLDADLVVVAAGWWSAEIMRGVGVDVPLQSVRSELLIVDPGIALPDLPVISDLIDLQYARVEGSGHFLVGNSDHADPTFADPDRYSNIASAAGVERAGRKVLHRFPGFPEPSVTHTYAGCYDITPDWNPVIGLAPVTGLYLAAGFSGHGFKISPAVGDLMADLIVEGGSSRPNVTAADFRLERFAEGQALTGLHPYAGAGQMR